MGWSEQENEIKISLIFLLMTSLIGTATSLPFELYSTFVARRQIIERFAALPLVVPEREDHVGAAEIRNGCRRAGVQLGTIDALLVQLCVRHELRLMTTDQDFVFAARHCPLRLWTPG
jgi:predicted nucleic acid-binding protein